MKANLRTIKPNLKGFEITFFVAKEDYIPIKECTQYELTLKQYRPTGTRQQQNCYYGKLRELADLVHIPLTEAHWKICIDYGAFYPDGSIKSLADMDTAELNRMIEGVESEIKGIQN